MGKIKLYSLVRLVSDIEGHPAGTTGTVVFIHNNANAYEVEIDGVIDNDVITCLESEIDLVS